MYVRIARFEGVQDNWDERIEEIRNRIRSGGKGTPMEGVRDAVKRSLMLIDRENGRGASVIFCDTAEDTDRVDQAMSQMSPPSGGGSRSSVEIYEVALDEQPA